MNDHRTRILQRDFEYLSKCLIDYPEYGTLHKEYKLIVLSKMQEVLNFAGEFVRDELYWNDVCNEESKIGRGKMSEQYKVSADLYIYNKESDE